MIVISGRQIRAARAMVGWTQEELAARAKVGLGTIKRMEGFAQAVGARTETLVKIVKVLERAGVEFLDDDRPGVRMRSK